MDSFNQLKMLYAFTGIQADDNVSEGWRGHPFSLESLSLHEIT